MQREKAFTLIEVIIVVAVIFALAAALIPLLSRSREIAKERAALQEIHQLGVALQAYADEWGYYPDDGGTPIDGCENLIDALEQKTEDGYGDQAYASWSSDAKDSDGSFIDPWDNPYVYRYNTSPGELQGMERGLEYNIWSFGPDKTSRTDDDIKNW